ncbi:polysaccharide biosynthesis tyrosine autokinase [Svornostia abyssi]|uniref:non-specific protein-tyrosine kinase n=1 Tax=Svornostia abyssi TaxID=2898438 RepID=A0ABY5PDZ2_9ACTN|nr:polysaccharide biosynthesis tyrosine autokinase [Parviterribacteraceae bacterium J379]
MAPDLESDDGFGLSDILKALRRRWWIVAICVIVTPAAALAFSLSQEKQYSATATLLFQDARLDNQLLGDTTYVDSDQERTAATNTAIAQLGTIQRRTEAAVANRFPDVDVNVSVEQSGTDNLGTVTATAPSPTAAAVIATRFAEEFITFRRGAERETVTRAIALLERRIARLERTDGPRSEIEELETRKQDLENLSAVQTGNVQLVERAEVPDSPSSPKTRRNVALGIFLGGLLGIALALLVDRLDRRIRDESEIEDSVEAPVLGVVPQSKAIARQKGGLEALRPGDVEAFRLLRAELRYFEASKDASCIMVTSSAPGEGKSTVAWNLALCAAESGARTLLIEADLRRPVLALKMGATPGEKGLSTVLSEQVTLSEALQHYEHGEDVDHTFDVLYAGPKPPNPGDLLESENMTALLGEVRRRYDYIVVDTAPVPVVSDPIPLLSQVDGVLVVTRLGKTQRDELAHLRRQLSKFKAPVLGVVINGGARVGDYAGYASYSYAGSSGSEARMPQLVARPGGAVVDVAESDDTPEEEPAPPQGGQRQARTSRRRRRGLRARAGQGRGRRGGRRTRG